MRWDHEVADLLGGRQLALGQVVGVGADLRFLAQLHQLDPVDMRTPAAFVEMVELVRSQLVLDLRESVEDDALSSLDVSGYDTLLIIRHDGTSRDVGVQAADQTATPETVVADVFRHVVRRCVWDAEVVLREAEFLEGCPEFVLVLPAALLVVVHVFPPGWGAIPRYYTTKVCIQQA